MNYKTLLLAFSLTISVLNAQSTNVSDSINLNQSTIYDLDNLLDSITFHRINDLQKEPIMKIIELNDSVFHVAPTVKQQTDSLSAGFPTINFNFQGTDSLLLNGNPLLIDMVYKNPRSDFDWKKHIFPYTLFFAKMPETMYSKLSSHRKMPTTTEVITSLRADALKYIAVNAPDCIAFRYEELPNTDGVKNKIIHTRGFNDLKLSNIEDIDNKRNTKMTIPKYKIDPWTRKASTMIQFSQNYVSGNWYQGGSKNIAILGILSGQLNYDNKKDIQWENNTEWRIGFNSVDGAIRPLNTNDDIFKINSKLGIKAGGKWFYSGSVDFSTQFFNNYKSITSTELKSSFLTPVRLNIGVGLDYKYKKLFSLMLSPVSYKYIYVNDIVTVNPNLFGIPSGEKVLSEIGSSFKAQLSYAPSKEIQIDSKLSFFTNYEKVEIDWEIVSNFTINRFLSTRLSLNPRYDNTQILAVGENAKVQFKELLSFGISYKFLN